MKRTYRETIDPSGLTAFTVSHRETDLYILADTDLSKETKNHILTFRGHIEDYICRFPEFVKTLKPWQEVGFVSPIVKDMIEAGKSAGTGPMAAVAGAIAGYVGRELLKKSKEIVVENGGDIFMKREKIVTAAVFAAKSPLSMKLGILVDSREKPLALCTSSGTVGHSLSLGKADAVAVLADNASLADAVATAVGNRVVSTKHMEKAVRFGTSIQGVSGVLVIMDDKLAAAGKIEIAPVA